jgi:type II secretory pathway component GspD/PulD (secretin)
VKLFARLFWATCCLAFLPIPVQPAGHQTASAALEVKQVAAGRAADILRAIFPDARITVDPGSNAIVVLAPQPEIDAMRQILPSIDSKDPRAPTADVVHLNASRPQTVVDRIGRLFADARLSAGPNDTVLVLAPPTEMDEIKSVISDIDVAPAAKDNTVVVQIAQAQPRSVARIVERELRSVRADVAGNSIIFTGGADEVARAKTLAEQLDVPPLGAPYVQTYRLGYADASAAATMIERSFPAAAISVDKTLNAVSVNATQFTQARIASAIAAIDVSPGAPVDQPGTTSTTSGPGGTAVEVINLRAAVPGPNGTQSTSASDIATTVMQTLGQEASDLHITIEPNSTRLVLSGSQYSVALAKQLIEQLDTQEDLVVLDTQIFEVDETDAKDLGLVAGTPGSPFLSTTISEYPPQVTSAQLALNPNASPPPFFSIQPLTRTPLSLNIALNALIQNGSARILANPRITTISGRTATIRAGDNISVLTQTPGGVGVPPTSQIQTFQTGITLDITPIINQENFITVNLHPTVNSLSSTNSEGIPQISTRDTQTTVGMRADQTLIIGGLIEDDTTVSKTSIPLLGNIPVIGGLFRSNNTNRERDELVISITPHIIAPGQPSPLDSQAGGFAPTPGPLPTVPPVLFIPRRAGVGTTVASGGSYAGRSPYVSVGSAPAVGPKPASTGRPTFTIPDPTPTALTLSTMHGPAGTYTYGAPTSNNQAGPNDAITIYYVTVSPNVVASGTQVTLNATTSTNVTRLLLLNGNTSIANITSVTPGYWQAQFPFSTVGLSPTATQVTLVLTALKADGTSTSIQFPVGITPCGATPPQTPTFGAPTPAPC